MGSWKRQIIVSTGANIAEGNSSYISKQKKRYVEIALNPSYELDNWLQAFKESKVIICDKDKIVKIKQ